MAFSISSIPRADRGSIWSAAEQLQRHNPSISAADAFKIALAGYEHGAKTSTDEQRIAHVAANNPAAMFQGSPQLKAGRRS